MRELASILGKLNAYAQALVPERLRTNALRLNLKEAYSQGLSWEDTIVISTESLTEINFWLQEISNYNGKPVKELAPKWTSRSDASQWGYGGTLVNHPDYLYGFWEEDDQRHINIKETHAVELTLKNFILKKNETNSTWLHQTDNTTAMSVINNQGSQSQELNKIVLRVWEFCLNRGITLKVSHLPGKLMGDTDRLSRIKETSAEWKLNSKLFQVIDQIWGPHQIDLFASKENSQLEHYCSLYQDNQSIMIDSFLMSWKDITGYAFPPFNQIMRMLKKVKRERATITVVLPLWKGAIWYPIVNQMAIDHPRVIKTSQLWESKILNKFGQKKFLNQIELSVWRISGLNSLILGFQNKRSSLYFTPGQIFGHMLHAGEFGEITA